VFLSQNFFFDRRGRACQARIQSAGEKDAAASGKDPPYNPAFIDRLPHQDRPSATKTRTGKETTLADAARTYDSVGRRPASRPPPVSSSPQTKHRLPQRGRHGPGNST